MILPEYKRYAIPNQISYMIYKTVEPFLLGKKRLIHSREQR